MSKIKDSLPLIFREWGFSYDQGLQRIVSPRGKVLAVTTSNRGYYLSTVCCPDGSKVTIPIAQAAAYEKYGGEFISSGLHVRHLNGIPTDNSLSNIALGTPSQNERDKPAALRSRAAKIARAAQGHTPTNAKLSEDQVREIRSRLHESDTVLAAEFGVSRANINNIRRGISYSNVK